MKKTSIGVLFGGKSPEHEVSIASAASIVANLSTDRYEVIPVALTKENTIVTMDSTGTKESIRLGGATVLEQKCVLLKDENHSMPLTILSAEMFDVVIPVVHGSFGEDGRLQGFLEMLGIPYVGSSVLGSAIGMDKVLQKQFCIGLDIPMLPFTFFTQNEWDADGEAIVKRIEEVCGYPCFVKPANAGSSVGISKAKNREELEIAIVAAQLYDPKVIVERGLDSPREIEAAVIGYKDILVAEALAEVKPDREFYDYDAKYDVNSTSEVVIPAQVDEQLHQKIEAYAKRLYQLLNVSGLSRIDFFVTVEGHIYWNEINTLPGFTPISAFSRMWKASGMGYTALLDYLISCALERQADKDSIHYEA